MVFSGSSNQTSWSDSQLQVKANSQLLNQLYERLVRQVNELRDQSLDAANSSEPPNSALVFFWQSFSSYVFLLLEWLRSVFVTIIQKQESGFVVEKVVIADALHEVAKLLDAGVHQMQ